MYLLFFRNNPYPDLLINDKITFHVINFTFKENSLYKPLLGKIL